MVSTRITCVRSCQYKFTRILLPFLQMILSIPAGDSRPYIDQNLIYSTPEGRPFDTTREYTFRAKNGEMNRVYRVEHTLLGVTPSTTLPQLRSGSYRELTPDQVSRLKIYMAGTSRNLRGYDQTQDYFFLVSGENDVLPNRPQMFPNLRITKGFSREALARGGHL